jgi:hypothetical protein
MGEELKARSSTMFGLPTPRMPRRLRAGLAGAFPQHGPYSAASLTIRSRNGRKGTCAAPAPPRPSAFAILSIGAYLQSRQLLDKQPLRWRQIATKLGHQLGNEFLVAPAINSAVGILRFAVRKRPAGTTATFDRRRLTIGWL